MAGTGDGGGAVSRRNSVVSTQSQIERRQRTLLRQIATQRAILARAEERLAELTAELHETAPGAYRQMLQRKTAEILRQSEGVSS